MTGRELAQRIREAALRLGFAGVGIAPAGPLERGAAALSEWLAVGYNGEMAYMTTHGTRADPRTLLDEARSVVVAALAYPRNDPHQASLTADHVARYARGDDYHAVIRAKLEALARSCVEIVGGAVLARSCVDTAPLLEREAAAASGLGFIAKSTMLIVPGVGSSVLLGELLLDIDLPSGVPIASRCGQCTACLDACPTGAFVAPRVLDARRCISYSTIELRGPIPRELRALHGAHLFGCDVCQDVCPFNGSPTDTPVVPEMNPRAELATPRAEEWLALGSGAYRRLVAGTALRRASRNQLARNAAVVLGNRATPDVVPLLSSALHRHVSPVVRGHAAWALGRTGTDAARRALAEARGSESDAIVLEEIDLALEAG